MFKHVVIRSLGLMAGGVFFLVLGCGGGKGGSPKSQVLESRPKTNAIDPRVFAPLSRATTAGDLPLLMGPDGEDHTPCLKTVDSLLPEEVGASVLNGIERNAVHVNQAIRNWFVDALRPPGLTRELASGWQIKVDDLKILEASADTLRFVKKQKCVDAETGNFKERLQVVTALIGARKFHFKTSDPIAFDVQEEMKKAVATEKFTMESDVFFDYEPALDDSGKPILDKKGNQLFRSPGGPLISEKEVPPPEKRSMKEWTLISERPLYFAFREIPEDAWRRESKKKVCDVNLVWNDLAPRAPDCAEFQESSFLVTKTKKGDVAVTIRTDGKNKGVTVAFDETEMIQVNDRILLWLSPVQIVEGAMIRVNSFVLNPRAVVSGGNESSEAYVPIHKPGTPSDASRETDKTTKIKDKKGKKKQRENGCAEPR